MEVNKSPGNDSLTKEFYEAFWDHVKVPLFLSLKMVFLKKELSTSQKQAVINLIEKKDHYFLLPVLEKYGFKKHFLR